MIHVSPAPEPCDFDHKVRRPGTVFLAETSRPGSKDWKNRWYWRRALGDLHKAYQGVCAYSCHWIPYDTGADTVEHFIAKSIGPSQAYEWANFRLVCQLLNARKGTRQILDPFEIDDEWFELRFPSLLVQPRASLEVDLRRAVLRTIEILGLNEPSTCLQNRLAYLREYCSGEVTFNFLQKRAPFLARELARQGLTKEIRNRMRFPGTAAQRYHGQSGMLREL